MRRAVLLIIFLVLLANPVSAIPDKIIDAKDIDLTKTVTFEELGFESEILSDFTFLITDPFVESEAIINFHIIKNPPRITVIGKWYIIIYVNGVLVSGDGSTKKGECWTKQRIPTGCLEKGINEIKVEAYKSREIILLEDSEIAIIPVNVSREKTLEDFGFETTTEMNSTIHFNSKVENPGATLKLHYKKIEPSTTIYLGNWNLNILINGVKIDGFVSTKEGENWREVEIPTGIMDKGDNILKFKSYDYLILLMDDSKFIIKDGCATQTAKPTVTPAPTSTLTVLPEIPVIEIRGFSIQDIQKSSETAPEINIEPIEEQTLPDTTVLLSGSASSDSGIKSVTVNGQYAGTDFWSAPIDLALGDNNIVIIATGKDGSTTVENISLAAFTSFTSEPDSWLSNNIVPLLILLLGTGLFTEIIRRYRKRRHQPPPT